MVLKTSQVFLGSDYNSSHILQHKNTRKDDIECEIRVLVHQSQAGCIIGRAGFKIKELREVGILTVNSAPD